MKFNRLFGAVLVLSLASLACASFTNRGYTNNILLADDFSNTKMKWNQASDSTRTTDYYNNAYRIVVNQTDSDAWSNPKDQTFTDVRIEVDATKNAGPDDNDFGIICRYSAADRYYYGVISSDGYYAIVKKTPNGVQLLGKMNLAESDRINKASASNHLRFDCVGSTLTLYVNGFQIDQQTDTDYTTGNMGLIAGTFSKVGTDILFDNLFVYKP